MKEIKAWAVVYPSGDICPADAFGAMCIYGKEKNAVESCNKPNGERVVRVTVRVEE